jgi:hypothetical protein
VLLEKVLKEITVSTEGEGAKRKLIVEGEGSSFVFLFNCRLMFDESARLEL